MPLITVVVSAYNRSNVLRLAIASVITQTFTDWELIVVGDACTDDTPEIVGEFKDTRIQFINLLENFGEQSGPNNVGVLLAKGTYIAFLNQDDLWFDDHLAICHKKIIASQASIVLTTAAAIISDDEIEVHGIYPDTSFNPNYWVGFSGWFVSKQVFKDLGLLRPFSETYTVPSYAYLAHLSKNNVSIAFTESLTLIYLMSGSRKNSYKDRQENENIYHFNSMLSNQQQYRYELICKILFKKLKYYYLIPIDKIIKNLVRRITFRLMGHFPYGLSQRILFGKKGGFLQHLRAIRGLPPIIPKPMNEWLERVVPIAYKGWF